MDQTTTIQQENSDQIASAEKPIRRGASRFFSIGTLVLGIVNILVGITVDVSLELDTGFTSFWIQCFVGVLIVISAFLLRARGVVSFLTSAVIFVYFYIAHIAPFLFSGGSTR